MASPSRPSPLTTYYDGVQPLTQAFDGFFIHSRGGAPAPLGSPNGYIDIAGAISGKPTKLRTDQAAPAIMIETETDVLSVLGYRTRRAQRDSDHMRLWEVAGTAHADAHPDRSMQSTLGCPTPINAGPAGRFVLRAALRTCGTGSSGPAPTARRVAHRRHQRDAAGLRPRRRRQREGRDAHARRRCAGRPPVGQSQAATRR